MKNYKKVQKTRKVRKRRRKEKKRKEKEGTPSQNRGWGIQHQKSQKLSG
jgi:hypothetical protein